jgi:hypothetical protein
VQQIDGRWGIVFDRVSGVSFAEQMLALDEIWGKWDEWRVPNHPNRSCSVMAYHEDPPCRFRCSLDRR